MYKFRNDEHVLSFDALEQIENEELLHSMEDISKDFFASHDKRTLLLLDQPEQKYSF